MNSLKIKQQLKDLGIEYQTGYFGGSKYCLGLPVKDHAHAFQLGSQLSLLCSYEGTIGYDRHGNRDYIVFYDAITVADTEDGIGGEPAIDQRKDEVGQRLGLVLMLKKDKERKALFQTQWGAKSAIGLFETVKRIMTEAEK